MWKREQNKQTEMKANEKENRPCKEENFKKTSLVPSENILLEDNILLGMGCYKKKQHIQENKKEPSKANKFKFLSA